MKIKRFVAPDMRQAMRGVREEQGPDAVILSTRRLDEGIEIIAAVDYDEALVREAARHGAPLPVETSNESATGKMRADKACSEPMVPESTVTAAPAAIATARTPPPLPASAEVKPSETVLLHPMMERAALDTTRMRAELGDLRSLLETQLSSLGWNDMERRHPQRARILRDLTRLGIEADIARRLVDDLPSQLSAEQARYLPLGVLSRSLAVSGRDLAADGGVTALVGPTGVGKTTTIAKLAAQAVLRHGAARVALVSTDDYRIGAAAQLEHYGRLLGVRVYPAHDADSLRRVLETLRDRHTVLVDTAGVAGSDPRLQQQMILLREAGALRACVVLAANAQAQALDATLRAYLPLRPQACILTKLDEAPSLGGALSMLIRHRVPLDYITDGQRVPEDIAAADARVLVCRAAQALKQPVVEDKAADDLKMAERFGLAMATA